MRFRALPLQVPFALILAVCAPVAPARTVYKCVDAHGSLTLQDAPCAAGMQQTREELEVPAEPAPRSEFDAAPSPVTEHVVTPPTPGPPPIEVAKPGPAPIWFCTRPEDGTRYVSRDGKPPTRWIPAGILGAPGKSLAEAYGPGGGAGLSAPGATKPKVSHAPPDGIAREYVEVADECSQGSEAQACDDLSAQLDDVARKLRRAFNAE
ncbi:MAG: DUF4124 domain-containing protein, partial [Rudaea sp.]